MPVESIEETQKILLSQSLLNSVPVRPHFLEEYNLEMSKTVLYLRDRDKNPILRDEMKDGINCFTVEINASLSKEDEVHLNNQ